MKVWLPDMGMLRPSKHHSSLELCALLFEVQGSIVAANEPFQSSHQTSSLVHHWYNELQHALFRGSWSKK